jgi:long-chain-fatty-acid--CoA ligase ACSBG
MKIRLLIIFIILNYRLHSNPMPSVDLADPLLKDGADVGSIYLDDKSLPYTSISLTQPVRLRLGDKGIGARPPKTVTAHFEATVQKFGSQVALTSHTGKTWTWSQYYADCKKAAAAFIAIGMKRQQVVNIIGFNSPEWFIADCGSIVGGGVAAGVYTTNEPEACHYVASHSEAVAVVCEGRDQLAKYQRIQDRLPHLKALIVYNHEKEFVSDLKAKVPVYTWDDFMKLGSAADVAEVAARSKAQLAGECCTLIYTSGTTGPPKAVMCSHDNITYTAAAVCNMIGIDNTDKMVSYLPLSHIAAQMLDIHCPMFTGYAVAFADSNALKGSIVDTLKRVEPTIFFAVPRVWEKIQEKMMAVGRTVTGAKAKISAWAKAKGKEMAKHKQYHSDAAAPGCYGCANSLVYSKVKANLGLGKMRLAASGASPISKETIEYFSQLNIHIMELYGMSECTGPSTCNLPDKWKIGSVGVPLPGTTLRLAPETSEITYVGRHVFMGYLKMDDQTKATIDSEGYLHSGDKGAIDDDGFLRITGRIKELIKTSGGENVAPILIENSIKRCIPAVSNVVVIGDNKKFLACLLTLVVKTNIDTGVVSRELTGESKLASASIGSTAETVEQVLACPKWKKFLDDGIAKSNKEDAISKAQYIQKWKILLDDFSLPGGELTPTLKLKRNVVYQKYAKEIEEVYSEEKA